MESGEDGALDVDSRYNADEPLLLEKRMAKNFVYLLGRSSEPIESMYWNSIDVIT